MSEAMSCVREIYSSLLLSSYFNRSVGLLPRRGAERGSTEEHFPVAALLVSQSVRLSVPQATRAPLFPDGWLVWSSGAA